MSKSYREMMSFKTFEERLDYLRLNSKVGETTFGFNRYINQNFYNSSLWKSVRAKVILRDDGCDLNCSDRPIPHRLQVHHINPITLEDFECDSGKLYDLDNLVVVSYDTHMAIHYGSIVVAPPFVLDRSPGDTKLW